MSEEFGVLIDRLDNMAHAMNLALPDATHMNILRRALPELVKELKAEFVSASGENPWEDQPE